MKHITGLSLMLGFLVGGIGVLVGGYAWALTGSLLLGGLVGGGFVLGEVQLWRNLGQRWQGFRFIGEVRRVVEEDFTEHVEEKDGSWRRVQQQGQQQPRQVADSIRRLLAKKPHRGRR